MKLKDLLRDVAPTISAVVGTANPLAGMALKFISGAVLGKPDATPDELEKAIAALPPDKLVELRISDNAFQAKALELGYRPDELTVQDRGNARAMQVAALAQADLFAKRFIYWYSWFWSLWSASYITAITFLEVPVANQRVVDTILGFVLGTLVASLLGFWYGTSFSERGAKKADDRAAAGRP